MFVDKENEESYILENGVFQIGIRIIWSTC